EEPDVKLLGRELRGDEDIDGRRSFREARAQAVGHPRWTGEIQVAMVDGEHRERQREKSDCRMTAPALERLRRGHLRGPPDETPALDRPALERNQAGAVREHPDDGDHKDAEEDLLGLVLLRRNKEHEPEAA